MVSIQLSVWKIGIFFLNEAKQNRERRAASREGGCILCQKEPLALNRRESSFSLAIIS